MYKLVAVGGKMRGAEYPLREGDNFFGRSSSCDHTIALSGISKKHFNITVDQKHIQVIDVGSANGTIVNDTIIDGCVSLKVGDKIALPNMILQVVYQRSLGLSQEELDSESSESQYMSTHRKGFLGGLITNFEKKFMPLIYQMNEAYQWRVMLAIFLFIFLSVNILLTIGPILQDTSNLLISEIRLRGSQYVAEAARVNVAALGRGELDKVDTRFLDNSKDVVEYYLFDREGRIIRPYSLLNTYYSDSFSVEAKSWISQKKENYYKDYFKKIEDGKIGVAKAILGRQGDSLNEDIIGYISLHFSPSSLAVKAANNKRAYLEALILSSLVGVLFYAMIYYFTLNPWYELRRMIEEFQKGKVKEVYLKHQVEEIQPLVSVINSILIRNRELLENHSGEVFEAEDDRPYVEMLKDLSSMSGAGALGLDTDKNIVAINYQAEELLGIRESMASGASLLDTLREQGLSATILDLCDQSASNDGIVTSDNYEVSGIEYRINVKSIVGVKDNFSKGFIIMFSRE